MPSTKITSLARAGLVAQAIDALRGSIADGTWAVGHKIPVEPALGEMLGVGRNTVREAVRALVHSGLLETRQGQGTFVVATSELTGVFSRVLQDEDMRDVVEVRRALETAAAELAAERRTKRDLTKIKQALDRGNEPGLDQESAIAADAEFHLAIVSATGNQLLIKIYGELVQPVRAYVRTMRVRKLTNRPAIMMWHAKLYEAIAASDPKGARLAAVAHFDQRPAPVGDLV